MTLKEVGEGEYDDFYRQLTLDSEPPLLHMHLITDAPVNIRSIIYLPRRFDRGPWRTGTERGLRLYSHKVLIQEHAKDLLPEHLSFVEGVVDSEDIPLNISRETVQSNRVMRQIQKVLAGRIVKELRDLAKEKPEDYASFLTQLTERGDFDAKHRQVRRFFTAGAKEDELDGAGRLSIPANLREYAKLEREVTVIGNDDRIELWNTEAWAAYNGETEGRIEEVTSELAELSLL
jgi:division/cell wall cluster transcriptional repressor MraZ